MESRKLKFIENMANDRIEEKKDQLKRLKMRLELYEEMNKDTKWIKEKIKLIEEYLKIAIS